VLGSCKDQLVLGRDVAITTVFEWEQLTILELLAACIDADRGDTQKTIALLTLGIGLSTSSSRALVEIRIMTGKHSF
jgi:hypothetical protein